MSKKKLPSSKYKTVMQRPNGEITSTLYHRSKATADAVVKNTRAQLKKANPNNLVIYSLKA